MESAVNLNALLDEFYRASPGETGVEHPPGHGQLATFHPVHDVPAPYRELLNHDQHMTVTVESFYQEPVDVSVHRHREHERFYSREITLVTHQSKRIVQYGIVRLNIDAVESHVWDMINSRKTPLGRVLIQNDVLRKVQLVQLWKIQAGPCLAEKMHSVIGQTFYGRTAMIFCDGTEAIELLEIVASVDQPVESE
jgi:chorismate-pyruvate lyase